MNKTIVCPDCQKEMQEGFIPDFTYGGMGQAHWHEGEPKTKTLLGMNAGLQGEPSLMKPVVSFRCTQCGLLKHYAP